MLILPAIDLRDGKCVRLTQGDFDREKVYASDPASVARDFEEQGAQFLHVVDLDGAKQGKLRNLDSVQAIIEAVKIPIELGGGIRSLETARAVLDMGVERVVVGTKLVEDRNLASAMFNYLGERVIAGIDAKNGKVSVGGWTETSTWDAVKLALELENLGAKRFVVTDIATDGALTGPNTAFLKSFLAALKSPIIASGGVSSLEDLKHLTGLRLEGIIVGKALYEGCFTLREVFESLSL